MGIKKILVSTFKKEGIVDFVKALKDEFHVDVLSSGGTAKILRSAGIEVQDVSTYTGAPELFGGRIKTIHPRIAGGLLFRRDNPQDIEEANANAIESIDMVVSNLYPFQDVIKNPATSLDEAVEMIDVGGPTMIRAAAKNFAHVTVVSSPDQHAQVLKEMREHGGDTTLETRMKLAIAVFKTMAEYDASIFKYLETHALAGGSPEKFPDVLVKVYEKVHMCRYGENWDQAAAFYTDIDSRIGIGNLGKLWGKEISFNNYLDIDSCFQTLLDLTEFEHACVIFKHTNPNGVAVDSTSQLEACKRAFSCDPLSAFGGIWGFNKPVEPEVARFLIEEKNVFIEVLIAPKIPDASRQIMAKKENMRVLEFGDLLSKRDELYKNLDMRGILGGMLVQDYDWGPIVKDWNVMTKRPVSGEEKKTLIFAMKIAKWAKSNSAVFARSTPTGMYTIGIGTGQQSRVHVVKLAHGKALEFGHETRGSVMATDSFFPFPDGLEAAVAAGAVAVLCPGGSIRDKDVISKADALNASLVFTKKRVFRH
nr:bifunctional phosphoribosylaminoimidazolecarboxamide formyltransferase/IMP cyclohydrolase [Candidatus Sigynarchaeum springense]MDO8116370.1 bifunctional phosphoribosylaminoimidazolecarboxamide formyltransferase/IMP cyclohydrolase [Candidatus Sigynarchaeota archaeon]